MMKCDIIIGIDPDIDKSGFAVLDTRARRMNVQALAFPLLWDKILDAHADAQHAGRTLCVAVEAGWLNAGNWHFHYTDSKAKVAALGRSVGMNHQTGIILLELCAHAGIPCCAVRPLIKHWKGRDGKITHAEITQFIGGLPKRTNQEERDAALLAWVQAGFAIRIAPKSRRNKTKI